MRWSILYEGIKLKEENMKKPKNRASDELRAEYDLGQLLKGAVRSKYAKRFHTGTNLVLLDPELRRVFRSAGRKRCLAPGDSAAQDWPRRFRQPAGKIGTSLRGGIWRASVKANRLIGQEPGLRFRCYIRSVTCDISR